jgi:hypothetical protein
MVCVTQQLLIHTSVYVLYAIQAAWNYYDSQKNTSDSFSEEEQESWNKQKKAASDKTKSDQ